MRTASTLKSYVTRHDWLCHEGQLHQQSWVCGNNCNLEFRSPQLFRQHMLGCHPGTFTKSQLPVLIGMCERPVDPDERASCPLCGEEATLRALQFDVASHLGDMALFVLPVEIDDHNTDFDSGHAERPRGNHNRLDDDELSSLGGLSEDEAVEAPVQDAKEFETALKTGEEGPLAQFTDWLEIDRVAYSQTVDLTSTFDLADFLESEMMFPDQGKPAEAEAMYLRAFGGCEEALGPEHTSTLNVVNNLGNVYMDQGKLGEAEVMYQRALG